MPTDVNTAEVEEAVDPQVTDLGNALARRIAQTTPLNDDGGTSTPASTDSTEDGEDGDAGVAAVVPPVPDSDAGGVQTTSEGAASQAAVDGEGDGVDEPPSPSTFKVGDVEYTASDIESLEGLRTWATNLAPELKQAFAAIEQGQAAAISADEYRKFQAWKSAQRSQSGDLHESNTADDLLADLDTDQRAAFEQLRLENEQLRSRLVPSNDDLATQRQIADQQVLTIQQVSDAWATEHGLDAAQVASLTDLAINHGMFDHFAKLERQFHPINGQLVRDADVGSVTRKALNYALVNDPGLYTQVMTAQQSSQSRALADQQADNATSLKKARSASLSTAASQASITPPQDVTKLPPDELKAEMSKMISTLEGIPLHD